MRIFRELYNNSTTGISPFYKDVIINVKGGKVKSARRQCRKRSALEATIGSLEPKSAYEQNFDDEITSGLLPLPQYDIQVPWR
ncbi:unnamed protein product [Haemonchus placei]|uniref:Uncharacterized protein n=1 Tax=Haemonchus placei TaxID=6290 RepID=A0A0N4WGV6_HAEPC|nr:unnamed protein product [Haemonchus placei]